jgi:hypothetical protein
MWWRYVNYVKIHLKTRFPIFASRCSWFVLLCLMVVKVTSVADLHPHGSTWFWSPVSVSGIRIPNADSRCGCRSRSSYSKIQKYKNLDTYTITNTALSDKKLKFSNILLLFKKSVYFKDFFYYYLAGHSLVRAWIHMWSKLWNPLKPTSHSLNFEWLNASDPVKKTTKCTARGIPEVENQSQVYRFQVYFSWYIFRILDNIFTRQNYLSLRAMA